ncbi:Cof-type HAD-IIB family hydrolase [Endozoicomonas sp. ONNA2]|uniref:Cof-type HAD-IIB family hydrolase n=1 Tax=Endozoicomonas sp. ONNA2 TaxID=2828741 RepID=UPI002148B30A|nr:Cof-type HAD-IIB family hydrolase [Endozoicomonas sp. ONNA2]
MITPDYKLLAFDLDGTLLNSKGDILASSKKAIKAAQQLGVKVVLVTGRHHVAARPYHYELGLDTPAICCNGAYIMDYSQPEPIYSHPLSKDQARRIIHIAREQNLHILMYVEDAMTFEVMNPHMEKLYHWAGKQPEIVKPVIRQIDDALRVMVSSKAIHKFVLSHPEQDRFLAAYQHILSLNEFSCERSWVDRMDIANNGNTKGSTLSMLAGQWGIDRQDIIAVGDNDNDISMIQFAGLGVAMGHCSEPLKPQANVFIGSNDEDSIAELIETHITGITKTTAA